MPGAWIPKATPNSESGFLIVTPTLEVNRRLDNFIRIDMSSKSHAQ